MLTADPNIDPNASLISEIQEVSPSLEAAAGAASAVGSGGHGLEARSSPNGLVEAAYEP